MLVESDYFNKTLKRKFSLSRIITKSRDHYIELIARVASYMHYDVRVREFNCRF